MDSNQDFGSILNNFSGSSPNRPKQDSGDGVGSLLNSYEQARTQPTRSVTDESVGGGNVDEFVKSVAPAAQKVAQRLNVPVEAVIGQWGVETGWGKSVIPGTNNLGNIKDVSGKGVAATDNQTGSRDKYRQYGSVDEFADDFANLVGGGRYKAVSGSRDAQSYFQNLQSGGYAEAKDYVQVGTKASGMAAEALKRAGVAPAQQSGPDLSKAPKWADVEAKPEFAKLSPEKQAEAKAAYFDYWIAPRAGARAGELREKFLAKTEHGFVDKALGVAKDIGSAVVDAVTPAKLVMEGQTIPAAPDLPTTSRVPVKPEVRAAFQAQWDAATPEQRTAMAQREDWVGMLAKERAGVFERQDAPGLRSMQAVDPRIEARVQRLVAAGEDPRFAERAAREAAAAGVAPGREIEFMQKGGGLAQKSEFDFDTKQLFDQSGGTNGLNNPLSRGLAKAGFGVTKAGAGYMQFLGDVLGTDAATGKMKAAGDWARGKENAIGESGNFMERNFEGAISSIAQQLPLLITGTKLESEAVPLAGMAMQSFGQEYSDGRAAGQSVGEATTRASIFAAFEVIGEKFGLKENMQAIKAAARGLPSDQIVGFLWSALKKEVPGELLTTTGQFATDKLPGGVGLNPNATGADYLKQVADTVAQTIMQSGIMAGGTTGVSKAVQFVRDKGPLQGVAEADAELARQQALNKWNANGLTGKLPGMAPDATPTTASVSPDGRIEPTLDAGAFAVTPAEPAGAPAIHPTSQTADDIVRELATEAGIPHETVLPTPAATPDGMESVSDQDVLNFAANRYQQLREKRDGTIQSVVGESGVVDQDTPGVGLSPAEQQELAGLERAKGDPKVLRALYGFGDAAIPSDQSQFATQGQVPAPATGPVEQPVVGQTFAAATEPGLVAAQENSNVETQQQGQATGPALDQGAVVPTGQPSGPATQQEPAGQAPAAQADVGNAVGNPGQQDGTVQAGGAVTEQQAAPAPQGQFASADDAKKYISQQRRASSATLPRALPLPYPDGTFGIVTEGSAGWPEAQAFAKANAPKTEKQAKERRNGTQATQAEQAKAQGQEAPAAAQPVAEAPASGGFDSAAFNKAWDDRIKASREAGNVHLDTLPRYVETMRGKRIYFVHDPKVTGTIRTVDNRGNVYVDWSDDYSAQKELASPVQEGKRTVMRSGIGPTDLKDYAVVQPVKEANPKTEKEAKARKAAKRNEPNPNAGTTEGKAPADQATTATGTDAATDAPAAGVSDTGTQPAVEAAGVEPKTAAQWAEEMARLRSVKPRPLEKLHGKHPTEAQVAAHKDATRKWESQYRKAAKMQKQTLAAENEARSKAAPKESTAGTATESSAAREVEKNSTDKPKSKADEPAKLTDAGEELTRNRRNKITGITWDDVKDMNMTLRVAQVTKSNVWQKPNYEKLVEDGAPRWKVAMLKAIYDKIAAKPSTYGTINDTQMRQYIETVTAIRDAVMAELDRVAESPAFKAINASDEVKSFADKGDDMVQAAIIMALRDRFKPDNVFGKVFPKGSSLNAFDRATDQGKDNNTRALLIGGNNGIRPLQFNYSAFKKARDLLMDGFPTKKEMWEKSYEVRAGEMRNDDIPEAERTGAPQTRYQVFEKGSRYRLAKNHPDGGFATEEQAIEFARSLTKKAKDDKPLPPSRGLDLASVQRTGPDWRKGKDVTSEDVKQAFGFRGVNLGEYVKANQKIAQVHLNHAYDALMDLADLFGIPPKAVSLNGTLGLAIGAQGSGKALAHFAPGVNEINITRDSGAGALAHEWGHALDHYFGVLEHGTSPYREAPFMSKDVMVKRAGDARPELREAFKTVVEVMSKRPMTEDETREWFKQQQAKAERGLAGHFKYTFTAKDQAAFDAAAAKLKAGDLGDEVDGVPQTLREFAKAAGITKLDNPKFVQLWVSAKSVADMKDADAWIARHKPQASTNYQRTSGAMDAKKERAYWSSPEEMFARAFETYVMDALAERQRESLYLSGLADGPMWQAWEALTGQKSPYPKGDERLTINSAIQKLVDSIEHEETDKGVRLFNTSRVATSSPMQLSTDAVKQAVQSALKRVPGAPTVDVFDSPLAAGITSVPSGVLPKGITLEDGSIIVFANGAESVVDVFETVFHELFHRGSKVRFTENADYINTMLDIAATDATVRDLVAEWKKSPDGQDKLAEFSKKGPMTGERLANYEAIAVEEALAEIGEKFADQQEQSDKSMLKRITDFLAKVAKAWGMDRLAQWLKNEKLTNTEKFVLETIRMSGGTPNTATTGRMFSTKRDGTDPSTVTRRVQNNLIQFFGNRDGQSLKTFGAYEKTLSTQYNKALKDKHFGKVFGYVNAMQNEVSLTSIRPAELAPGVLPRLDDVKSALATMVKGKPASGPLNHAAQAIFDGTLAGDSVLQGKVWTQAQFMARPGATEASWALYQQARAAIDASLDEVAAAEAYAMAQGFVPKAMRRQIIDNPGQAQGLIANDLKKQMRMLEVAIEKAKKLGAEEQQAELESALKSYQSTLNNIDKIFVTSKNLKTAGYAPLMRFGQFTVSVQQINPVTGQVLRDENGESQTLFYKQYETEGEAKAVRRQMQAKYADRDDVRVSAGTKSQTAHELYNGITPETLALFAEAIGADNAMRKYIELAMTERSALKRRLHRKGTEGYSDDLPRVLANFITSNGRHAAQRYYLRDLNNAIKYIPKEKGDVLDEANRLKKFVMNPNDAGAPLSSAMFAWFLGGSVASAVVNLTQPVMMTAPYLTQFGVTTAGKATATAMPYALGRKQITDAGLRDALKRASQEGIVDAQEIFHLYSVGAQGVAANLASALAKVPGVGGKIKAGSEDARARINAFLTLWGSMFAVAEGFNRKLTFIAAWEVAKANGEKNPYAFAVRAVNETQGIYNKVNRPNWGQGPVGRTLLTFKQYSIMYVELLTRMWKRGGPEGKRAALIMLAVLMLASGEEGLPFSQDLDDLIDTVGQFMGFDTNMRRNKRRLAHEVLGKTLGDLFLYGVSSYLPLDFAGRVGLGNLIPGTGALKPSNEQGRAREVAEIFGPTAGMATQVADAYDAVVEGNTGKAVQNLAPKAVKDALAAGEMAKKGYATDSRGRKVIDVTKGEAAIKGIGFNPTSVAQETRKTMPVQQDIALQKRTESSIVNLWVRGLADGDTEMVKDAQQRLNDWNRRNPDTLIRINPDQIRSLARQMATEKDTRLLKSAPREMRGRIGLDLMD